MRILVRLARAAILSGLVSVVATTGVAGCTTSSTLPSVSAGAAAPAAGKVSAAPDRTADSNGDGIGSFELCARGSYPSYAVFMLDAKARSTTVQPGACTSQTFQPSTTWHRVAIYGVDTDGSRFQIGVDSFGSEYDEHVKTTGTDDRPDWFSF